MAIVNRKKRANKHSNYLEEGTMRKGKSLFGRSLVWLAIFPLTLAFNFFNLQMPSAIAAETITVGVLTDLSGTLAFPAQEMLQGFQVAVDEWNEKGGIKNKKIVIEVDDDEGKPAVGLRKAEKMVLSKGIKYIAGTVNSAVALAISAKAPEWDIIYLTAGAKAVDITGKSWNKNTFRRNRNDDQDMMIVSAWLDDHPELKTWYCIGADYVWGRGNVAAFKKIAEAKGRTIVGEVFPEIGNKDYGSQIIKIIEKKPDAVWAALSGAWAIDFIKQAKSFGLSDKAKIAGVLLTPESVVRAAGPAAIGLYGNLNYAVDINTPENINFKKRFQNKFKRVPTGFNVEGYVAAVMLFNGIAKAKSEAPKDVIQALEGLEYSSPLGKELVRKEDHQVLAPNYMGIVVKSEKDPGGVVTKVEKAYSREKGAVPLEKTGLKR